MKNKIIKTLLLSGLLTSAAFADMYVGIDYGSASNTDSLKETPGYFSATQDNRYGDLGIKIGFGTDGYWKTQFRFSQITYDKAIFDSTHQDLREFDIDFIREFEISKNTYPFIKFGLGYGEMDVDGYSESSIGEASINAGVGLSFKVARHLYIIGGIDYVYRKWQDIAYNSSYTTYTDSVTGSSTKVYAGVNYKF